MQVILTKKDLLESLSEKKNEIIGFVPTMGALHQGHISLLTTSRKENDLLVCSIFINPTQFNNPKDLEYYPRPTSIDLAILEKNQVDIAFLPNPEEIYGKKSNWKIDLGNLDMVLEGKSRPGHFQGVAQIVKILFDLVKPNNAYFGLKDYQQFLVVKKLIDIFKLEINLVGLPIIREKDGLAMSSRNTRLSGLQRKSAPIIFQALEAVRLNGKKFPPLISAKLGLEILDRIKMVEPEYFEIVNAENLLPATKWENGIQYMALVAARLGEIRLIDNMLVG